MRTWMKPLALVVILSASGGGAALAQSKAAAPAQVTQAVTVVATRVPVVTVSAPREVPTGMPTDKRQPAPRPKAVDRDGDGLADAPAPRDAATGRPTGKLQATAPVSSTATDNDCDDAAERSVSAPRAAATSQPSGKHEAGTAPASGCAKQNPLYESSTVQGSNPLHQN